MNPFKGKCIIVSAPSGAGKTTIVKYLLETMPNLEFSISATSRPARPNEKNGKDYHFLSVQDFRQMIDSGDLLEWQEVYAGRYYGTPKSEPDRIWKNGKHIIFDLDVVGGINLKKYFGADALAIFVQAPSVEALGERLRGRSTESEDSLNQRLSKARLEMSFADQFDRILINDDLEVACAQAKKMVEEFLTE